MPDRVGGSGSVCSDMSPGDSRSKAEITNESIAGGGWSMFKNPICGATERKLAKSSSSERSNRLEVMSASTLASPGR